MDMKKIGIVAAIVVVVAVVVWYVYKHTNLLKKGTTPPATPPATKTNPATGAANAPKMSFASPFVGGQDIEFFQN